MNPKLKSFLVVVVIVAGFLIAEKFFGLVGMNKPHTLTEGDGLILIIGLFVLHDSLKDKLDDIAESLKNIEGRLK